MTECGCRELALDILMEILERGGLSHVVLGQALGKYQYLEKQDRAFVTRVAEGTLEYRIQIDWILDQVSRTATERMKPLIRCLLRMSAYQILYMDRIPDAAVCNEAVKLAKKRRFQGLSGYVNGVLRSVSRQKGKFVFPDDSIRYSMPRWLIDRWEAQYGPEITGGMLRAFLEQRPISVRCHLDRAGKDEIRLSLQSQGVTVTEHPYADDLLYLEHVDHMEALEAFRKGLITAQDPGSACVAKAAGIRKGDTVLDVCGAPGGKTLHALSILQGTGRVYARDISERKAALIGENLARCGYGGQAEVAVWDARVPDETMTGRADVVLADLPCSGLGVIGRKPDIKARIRPEDVETLAALQREILSVVWRCVKPGGTLVYSTCTVTKEENEENRDWFLREFPFEPADIRGRLEGFGGEESLAKGYLQLFPGRYPCDGFFLAVMRRKTEA